MNICKKKKIKWVTVLNLEVVFYQISYHHVFDFFFFFLSDN